ncbi:hypothetical protein P171DRAFT_483153 [Karstenula rhodostoma CBS 690.94]|uniref:Uncharacterized protein n=1 Tax=Karstenula rhodostoma CBS 690.94 TaxID=1392251 RepID=A0A9P4PL49_9PLEO|nr:hypothetical protein P171DRAFT_483153 [Karstenula rhodostoma CBS 690.94]
MPPKVNEKRVANNDLEGKVTKKIKFMVEVVDIEIDGADIKWKSMKKDLQSISAIVAKLEVEPKDKDVKSKNEIIQGLKAKLRTYDKIEKLVKEGAQAGQDFEEATSK